MSSRRSGRAGKDAVLLLFTAALLMLFAFAGSALAADRWTDITDAQWLEGYGVSADQAATVAAGYQDGTFRPQQLVTRGELAKMVVTGLGIGTGSGSEARFSDVPAGDGFAPFIARAAERGLITGYPDGTFRPAAPVTRQQADSILGMFLADRELALNGHVSGDYGQYGNLDSWYAAEGGHALAGFADAGLLAEVHAPGAGYLAEREVVKGSPRTGGLYLDPLAPLTRAQAVALILRVAAVDFAGTATGEPVVSTTWLAARLGTPGLIALDIRSADAYARGHIPGAVSMPFGPMSAWAVSTAELTMELPPSADLFAALGAAGITPQATVVIVGSFEPGASPAAHSDAARAAATLLYAGVQNVAILDGAYSAWLSEARPTTTEVPRVEAVQYSGVLRSEIFVSTEYVKQRLGKTILLDSRDPATYFGATTDSLAPQPGHIPGARSLPAAWVWESGGLYQSKEKLAAMAAGVAGVDKGAEIIVYCTIGRTASAWWYVLTRVLGYRDVAIYDGSAQAWVAAGQEMVSYSWSR